MDRRSFLKGAGATAAAAVPFRALIARAQDPSHQGGLRRGQTAGYGPLFETLDETTGLPLLLLPEGFKYVSFGWRGDLMANGQPTPGAHDGMAAFPAGNGRARLVRNHENGPGTPFSLRGLRLRRRRRHDDARVRYAQRRPARSVAQPERHDSKLRGRSDAVGKLADVRRDESLHDEAARVRVRSARRRPGRSESDSRHGPPVARSRRPRPGDRLRV